VCTSAPFVASSTTGGYAGGYAHLRGFVSPRSGTVIAARLAARALERGSPLDARYTLPGWEHDVTVLGGAEAHRSFVPGRFVGQGLWLGSIEIRHNLLDVGDYGAVTLIAFADAGRVFGSNDFRLTLDGWKVGGGGGVAIRVLRSALLVLNFAGGPDGFTFSMGNGWAF
jgi:outer membrane protein assembly factor BamA